MLPDTSTEHLIKRAIGLPGDRVICCDAQQRITVNGQPLAESGYLYTAADGTQVSPSEIPFDVVVPSKRIFVMGTTGRTAATRAATSTMCDLAPSRARMLSCPKTWW